MKNTFVGNLDFSTGEDELRQLFGQYGQVDRITIMMDRDTGRSRGFGFVEMASREDGDKAIAGLNGTQVGGRTLNVNEARPKVDPGNARGYDRVARVVEAAAGEEFESGVQSTTILSHVNARSYGLSPS